MAVFGTPNNTLVLGPFLGGPKTDPKVFLREKFNIKQYLIQFFKN
jgi:hypothetical protein